jgi:Protein of unknown function (DUF1091)
LVFNSIEVENNPDYLTSYFSIDNGTASSTIFGNITLRKELNYKITVSIHFYYLVIFVLKAFALQLKLDLFALPQNPQRPVFRIPKINYCDAVKKLPTTEGIDILFQEIEKSGTVFARCPLKVGFYQVAQMTIDDTRLPKLSMIKVTTSYRFQGLLRDENGKVPVVISKLNGQFTVIF